MGLGQNILRIVEGKTKQNKTKQQQQQQQQQNIKKT